MQIQQTKLNSFKISLKLVCRYFVFYLSGSYVYFGIFITTPFQRSLQSNTVVTPSLLSWFMLTLANPLTLKSKQKSENTKHFFKKNKRHKSCQEICSIKKDGYKTNRRYNSEEINISR